MNWIRKQKGFTLVELLLVIAIIGILATILMVGMGAWRKRTKTITVMETNRSALAYAIECYLRDKTLGDLKSGTSICSGSSISWPELKYGCSYGNFDSTNGGWSWNVTNCPGDNEIWCSAKEGKCCILSESARGTPPGDVDSGDDCQN